MPGTDTRPPGRDGAPVGLILLAELAGKGRLLVPADERGGLGLVQSGLQSAIETGAIAAQPVAPLAHVLIGALNESALFVARAEDRAAAREQCVAILDRILHGLRAGT